MTEVTSPHDFQPASLIQALGDAGWVTVGGNRDVVRLESPPDRTPTWLLLPRSGDTPDSPELIEAAWSLATRDPDMLRSLEKALDVRASSGPRDSLRFRKETDAPKGLIAWSSGESLIAAARQTLLAGAKSFQSKAAYFGNSHGRFAHRYLDACFMGQSAVGSYIVTALTPVGRGVRLAHDLTAVAPGAAEVDGRQVTEAVVASLEAAVDAVEQFKKSKSTEAFRQAVVRGLSADLARGLEWLAEDAEDSSISVDWEPGIESVFGQNEPVQFQFTAADVPALSRAHDVLVTDETVVERVTVQGRVHLLTRQEAGGPGVVGVDTGQGRYRVRLLQEDYHRAVQAHDTEQLVRVEGLPNREGSLTWLYNARFLAVIPRDPELF